MKIRLKFSKHGPVRFIGHLDVMRYFQKVLRRAQIPVKYSEGYSPHQLISFAQPLSVGATSDGEYMDIVLTETVGDTAASASGEAAGDAAASASGKMAGDAAASASGEDTETILRQRFVSDDAYLRELMTRMRGVMHEGIDILDGCVLPEKAENAMASVAACLWEVRFRKGVSPEIDALAEADWRGPLSRLLSQQEIITVKKTKKGLKEFDIRPFIYRAEADADGLFTLLLKAGSENNVKPLLFMQALVDFDPETGAAACAEITLPDSALVLHRVETYREENAAGETVDDSGKENRKPGTLKPLI